MWEQHVVIECGSKVLFSKPDGARMVVRLKNETIFQVKKILKLTEYMAVFEIVGMTPMKLLCKPNNVKS